MNYSSKLSRRAFLGSIVAGALLAAASSVLHAPAGISTQPAALSAPAPAPQVLQALPGPQVLQALPGPQVLQALPGPQALQALPGPVAPPAPPTAPVRLIMIIRHGEKPAGGGTGIDPSGRPDSHSLTSKGWSRADGLAKMFASGDNPSRPGLARPKTIYAAGATAQGAGTRTRQTMQPLAAKLGVPINTRYGKGQEAELAKQLIAQSESGPVLVCWQHGEIPALAAAFRTVGPAPPKSWPDDRYDMVWTLRETPQGWSFSQVPEMVLAGDSPRGFS